MIFIGNFINGEKNGKGKEYKNGRLKFDGEYLNGKKWNGKGYYSYTNEIYELKNGKGFVKEKFGGIRYEGEYLNGQRNGIGKEYDDFGNIYFEGEYLNGKKWNGKEIKYDSFFRTRFTGFYINGEIKK